MKGDLRLLLLQIIQLSVTTAQDIAIALTEYEKSNSYRKLRNLPVKLPSYKPIFQKQIARLTEKRKLNILLYKLEKEGLVIIDPENKIIRPTKKGLLSLLRLKNLEKIRDYKDLKGVTNEFKIIIFDIPESQREDRNWLREVLKILGFTFLQKSVWVGKALIPEEFIKDLAERSILDFVEIFAITKSGSLKQLN